MSHLSQQHSWNLTLFEGIRLLSNALQSKPCVENAETLNHIISTELEKVEGCCFLPYTLRHIHFNAYSMLFIKDITPSRILASCKTFSRWGIFMAVRLFGMSHMCLPLWLFSVWGNWFVAQIMWACSLSLLSCFMSVSVSFIIVVCKLAL